MQNKNTKIINLSGLDLRLLEESSVIADEESLKKCREAKAQIAEAAEIIRSGGLVAFPTETVYGLGADAFNSEAVKRIYEVKGRPQDNPMIVHIARASDISRLSSSLSPDIIKLIDAFWPGPLTLVLKKKEEVPLAVTGGLNTVAVRLPDDGIALELIRSAGTPVAAPSANISGKPSPTRGDHVIVDLNGLIDAIIIGAECRIGIESTVLDVSGEIPVILRPGIVGTEDIEAVIDKEVKLHPALLANSALENSALENSKLENSAFADPKLSNSPEAPPKSPGMKYRHYAPEAEMMVLEGDRDRVRKEIDRLRQLNEGLGRKVGTILFEEKAFLEAAHDLFAELRALDETGVDLIIAGALSRKDSLGFAVMNRMMKAAGYNIVKV
jgi:L-threonylcarbamoyladenylate synthase